MTISSHSYLPRSPTSTKKHEVPSSVKSGFGACGIYCRRQRRLTGPKVRGAGMPLSEATKSPFSIHIYCTVCRCTCSRVSYRLKSSVPSHRDFKTLPANKTWSVCHQFLGPHGPLLVSHQGTYLPGARRELGPHRSHPSVSLGLLLALLLPPTLLTVLQSAAGAGPGPGYGFVNCGAFGVRWLMDQWSTQPTPSLYPPQKPTSIKNMMFSCFDKMGSGLSVDIVDMRQWRLN